MQHMPRIGQNPTYTPYMTVCMVIPLPKIPYMHRVGQNHIYIYGVYTAFLAGKSPNVRSYMVYVYGSGQPYVYTVYTY